MTVHFDENHCQDKLKYSHIMQKHLANLLNYSDVILREERFSAIMLSGEFFGTMYAPVGDSRLSLGKLLSILRNEQAFAYDCHHCGGKSFLIRFGGSPLSGIVYHAVYQCIEPSCSRQSNYYYRDEEKKSDASMPRLSVMQLIRISEKYKNVECSNVASIAELFQLITKAPNI